LKQSRNLAGRKAVPKCLRMNEEQGRGSKGGVGGGGGGRGAERRGA